MTAVMSCWLVSTAQAGPITFSDIYDPAPDIRISQNGLTSWTYTHTLSGFQQSTDTLTDASLRLTLRDDNDNLLDALFAATFDLKVDNQKFVNIPINNSTTPTNLTYDVFASLNADNLLNITLSLGNDLWHLDDFYFQKSTLTANGTRSVPEPSASLLLGLGLLGIVGYCRFQKRPQAA
jgi:hypothetical protein